MDEALKNENRDIYKRSRLFYIFEATKVARKYSTAASIM